MGGDDDAGGGRRGRCRTCGRKAATGTHACELVVSALDPPCFGPDGAAVRLHDGGHAAAWLPG
jgi:hypothetical protein